jgi:8-oxo-dGTP pyrophosphatase MutT (NUDIX family)
MDPGAPSEEVILDTKWFQLVARHPPAYTEPHYSIQTLDYVHIVALTPKQELLLVRQFRPAIWQMTLELPCGHVEKGQTPEKAARAELLEETGYEAEHFELLAEISPDVGRLGNRMWCFFASNAVPTREINHQGEAGVDFVLYRGSLHDLVREKGFRSALNHAALFAAMIQGKLKA